MATREWQFFHLERNGKVAVVTIDRPPVNALSEVVILELGDVFRYLYTLSDLRVVIITGAGDKAFIAGADINTFANPGFKGKEGKEFSQKGHQVMSLVEDFPVPVIAAINGLALGGGCEVALCCDLRVAEEQAHFGQPEVNLGIIPGAGGTQRLARLIGAGRAKELLYTGRHITAAEAERIGLVNKVVSRGQSKDEAMKIAGEICQKSPNAVRLVKEATSKGLRLAYDDGLRLETELFGLACAHEEKCEGTRAFLEKRKPEWMS